MKNTYYRSVCIIKGNDAEQGYGIRTEYKTNIPYDIAKIMFDVAKDYYSNKENILSYSKEDELDSYRNCFLDYCKFLSETVHLELKAYVCGKNFEDLTDFFYEHSVEKCKNTYYLDGEEISGQIYDEGLELGFTSWTETAMFKDNIENKSLLAKF